LRRFVSFPYKLLNVADVIIMHSVEKNSLIYAQLSTLAWAACGFLSSCQGPLSTIAPFKEKTEPEKNHNQTDHKA